MLTELLPVCPDPEIFDLAVLENGGVLYRPSTREEVPLAAPPPQEFLKALRRRGVQVLVGRVAVESSVFHRQAILTAIRDCGIPRDFTFNKSSIIILPPNIDKASGLRVALAELGIDAQETAGIGDAENDHALLAACGLAVAVPHATAALKREAHEILGPIELIDKILSHSLLP